MSIDIFWNFENGIEDIITKRMSMLFLFQEKLLSEQILDFGQSQRRASNESGEDEEKTMFCNKCGKENEEGVKFCGYCGNSLIQEHGNTVAPTTSVENSITKEKKGKKKSKSSLIICLILLIAASSVGGGILKQMDNVHIQK